MAYAIIPRYELQMVLCNYARTSMEKGGLNSGYNKMLEEEQIRKDLPAFNVGDTVQVHYRVVEGTRERIQIFEGTVIKKKAEELEKHLQ